MIRIDKFLKFSRLVKRRSVAAEMVQAGAVRLNGRVVKPSAEVKAGDNVAVAFPFRLIEAQVLVDDEAALRRRGVEPVTILNERRLDPEQSPWSE